MGRQRESQLEKEKRCVETKVVLQRSDLSDEQHSSATRKFYFAALSPHLPVYTFIDVPSSSLDASAE